jgi:hypothetical protein
MVSLVNDALQTLLTAQSGVASAADLRKLGLTRVDLRRLVASGELVRIRRGAFVDGHAWSAAAHWGRHALRALAVQRSLAATSHLALSHHSSLVLDGVAVHGVDDRVHMVRTDGGRSRPGDVLAVHAGVPESFVRVDRHGARSVQPALACLQVAAAFGVEAGLVATESALRQKLCSREDLAQALEALGFVVGCRSARRVVELAQPLSESAGESRCRWVFLTLGLPLPIQQAWIHDRGGVALGRVDFLFEAQRVIVEFDGRAKYSAIGDVHREKAREDAMRALGYEVVRLTWADLAKPDVVGFKIHAAFARARSRASA